MIVTILNLMIKGYRANPVRPHCDSRAGIHTLACSLIMPGLSRIAGVGPECDMPSPPKSGLALCGEQPSNSPHWRKSGLMLCGEKYSRPGRW
jgi:hypothetical protein